MRDRADTLFDDARIAMLQDGREMIAEHAAKSRLQSGSTVKRACSICEARTDEALRACLDSVTTKTEHRGRKWHRLLDDVEASLKEHFRDLPETLKPFLLVVGAAH